ncbi:MAG: hypothetical protein IIY88_00260 [Eubacterium sp.]|nr:hypothetical protein [Eubacterium sp.]
MRDFENKRVNRFILCILALVMCVTMLSSCGTGGSIGDPADDPAQSSEAEISAVSEAEASSEDTPELESSEMSSITMKINGEEVKVNWEENESVKALLELAAEGPVTVETSLYGGFEQVGPIGTSLPSSDVSTKTKPGDIVLYTSDKIVVFFGSNSWSYTRLGHIEDKSEDELREMLSGSSAVITITNE